MKILSAMKSLNTAWGRGRTARAALPDAEQNRRAASAGEDDVHGDSGDAGADGADHGAAEGKRKHVFPTGIAGARRRGGGQRDVKGERSRRRTQDEHTTHRVKFERL